MKRYSFQNYISRSNKPVRFSLISYKLNKYTCIPLGGWRPERGLFRQWRCCKTKSRNKANQIPKRSGKSRKRYQKYFIIFYQESEEVTGAFIYYLNVHSNNHCQNILFLIAINTCIWVSIRLWWKWRAMWYYRMTFFNRSVTVGDVELNISQQYVGKVTILIFNYFSFFIKVSSSHFIRSYWFKSWHNDLRRWPCHFFQFFQTLITHSPLP